MKRQRFEDAHILTPNSFVQLLGDWFLKLENGTVLLVRSKNVPDLKDHYIVVTGKPIMKDHGLRPQTLTIGASNKASAVLDQFNEHAGATVLMLTPYMQKCFLNHHNITIDGGEVKYSNLLIVEEILNVFEMFRMAPSAIDQYEQVGKGRLSNRILNFIEKQQPVKFSMLGYPFKSSNTRDKVLGYLPDAAEEKSFENFANFGRIVKQIYTPGIEMSIISDGYIFSDVFGVDDDKVKSYNETVREMAKVAPVVMYDGMDFFKGNSLYEMREHVITNFGPTKEELQKRILTDLNVNELYRGMIIFMQEENATKAFPSNSQREKAAKVLAREAMVRNEAYSTLIQHEFADHIRLSMHNSTNDGTKYSIKLLAGNSKYSPWHSALVVKNDTTFETMHRIDAQNAGYELVLVNNQPYYFQQK